MSGQSAQKLQIGMIKALTLCHLRASLTSVVAGAQETGRRSLTAPSFDEVQVTIKRMQERLDRLGGAAAERDQALRFLAKQVEQATGEIAGTGKTNESLTGQTAVLSKQLQDLSPRSRRPPGAGRRAWRGGHQPGEPGGDAD